MLKKTKANQIKIKKSTQVLEFLWYESTESSLKLTVFPFS